MSSRPSSYSSSSSSSSTSVGKYLAFGAVAAAALAAIVYLTKKSKAAEGATSQSKKKKKSPASRSNGSTGSDASGVPTPTSSPTPSSAGGFFAAPQPKSYGKLGSEAVAKGQYAKALEYFSLAIQEQDTNNKLYTNRANVYVSMKRYEDALRDATKSILLSESPSGYLAKGAAHQGLEQYREAMIAFESVLYLPESTDRHKQIATKKAEECAARCDEKTIAAHLKTKEATAAATAAAGESQTFVTPATDSTVPESSAPGGAQVSAPSTPSSTVVEVGTEAESKENVDDTTAVAAAGSPTVTEPETETEAETDATRVKDVEFNPENHDSDVSSNDSSLSNDSAASGIMVSSHPETEDSLSSSATLKESAVFVEAPTTTTDAPVVVTTEEPASSSSTTPATDLLTSPKLAKDVKQEMQETVAKKQTKKNLKHVQEDLVTAVGRKETKKQFENVKGEIKSGRRGGKKKSDSNAQSTAAASSSEATTEKPFDPATMHPSMLATPPVETEVKSETTVQPEVAAAAAATEAPVDSKSEATPVTAAAPATEEEHEEPAAAATSSNRKNKRGKYYKKNRQSHSEH